MKKDFLDSINVKSPCHESWEKMTGNDEVRFCSHCAKDVHDLSAMTRKQAEKLVKNANGNICVRYVKTPQGKLVTAPPILTQITRRARVAAGVFAASLALSAVAYSQGEPVKPRDKQTQAVKNNSAESKVRDGFSTVSGIIKDTNDAVVPGAKVILRIVNNQKTRYTQTDADGFYEFANVEPDVYEIEIEYIGFKKLLLQNLVVAGDKRLRHSVVLEVAETLMGVVGIAEEPVETNEPEINQTVQQQELLELPRNPRTITTLGLIPAACSEEKPKPKKSKKTKKKKN